MGKPADDDDDSGKGLSRRALLTFWRRPLEELSKPAPEPPQPLAPPPSRPAPLRPPGVLHEYLLLNHCTHCGKCVEVCPAHAIFPLGPEYGAAAGTPAIDARKQPCVLCTGLRCTQVCPSGALLPLHHNADVAMGTARVDQARCLTWRGQACTACRDVCPKPGALGVDDIGQLLVNAEHCVGCGLCERHCPTEPQSIRVVPRD